jgi:hypothetical protein
MLAALLLSTTCLLGCSEERCLSGSFTVSNLAPAKDSARVHPFTTISGTLTPPANRIGVHITDRQGEVGGVTEILNKGSDFQFKPNRPLQPGTVDVEVHVEACTIDYSFEVAGAEPYAGFVVGHTFRLQPALLQNIRPAVLASLLSDFAEDHDTLLLEVVDAPAGTVNLISKAAWESGSFGPKDEGQQDLCSETVELPPLRYAGPVFESPPVDWTFEMGGYTWGIDQFELIGWLSADASSVDMANLRGRLDLRPMESVLGVPWEDLCALVAGSDTPCVACSLDGGLACMSFELEGIMGNAIDAPSLVIGSGPNHPGCVEP